MINFSLIFQSLPDLLRGSLVSIQIALSACAIGFTGGVFLGLLYSSNKKFILFPVNLYVSVIRGTPMLIQVITIFYVLPQLGIQISAFWAAIIALGCNSSAYVSQIMRTGIASVSIGQIEAASTLGINKLQIFFSIILPQAIRNIFPALGNELVTLVKDSSLASIIGVMELSKYGSIIRSRTYDAFSILLIVAVFYLCLTNILTYLLKVIEKRMEINVKNSES